jgi:hypothetical protein
LCGIGILDAVCHGLHHGIVGWIGPGLKIIAVLPHDVGETLVSSAEIGAVIVVLCRTVSIQDAQPTAGLDGIEYDREVVGGGETHHGVKALEVSLIGGRQVAGSGEGHDAIVGAAIGPSPGICPDQHVDQHGVEPVSLSIGEVAGGLVQGEVDHHRLRRISDHQERDVVLIDQIATVGARLDGKGGSGCSSAEATDGHTGRRPQDRCRDRRPVCCTMPGGTEDGRERQQGQEAWTW